FDETRKCQYLARREYQHSKRADAPFLAVNCAAIPESLLESELFGHEKGAFTGADRRHIGKFEQCNGGTIFLDEIGDMPLTLQSKMLRLLQDQRFERVGGNETIQTDVRIIAATHRDLEKMADENQFRADLYFRLNVFSIALPPLRERIDDLPLLVNHFLALANEELEQDVQSVAPETLDLLCRFEWPGNIRELQSVLKQAVLNATGSILLPDFLPDIVRESLAKAFTNPVESTELDAARDETTTGGASVEWDRYTEEQLLIGTDSLYDDVLALIEKRLISRVLRHTEGNQAAAAKILGITRATIRNKIKQRGIKIGRLIEGEDDQ
ncbi:MAG: sigma-54 dependent transcriptional regulator, partial [Planctomycetota bacterium]|nr:sigma-54 dependent transcriptional regulator [Planctomycetota bacterium]